MINSNLFRKTLCVTAAALIFMTFVSVCAEPVTADQDSKLKTIPHNWYCKNNKTHTKPELDPALKFIEKHEGYYIDKRAKNDPAESDDKVLYLTFDAGYENGNVEKILNTLKEENVPGAFFVLDNLILRNTELVKRMTDEGHTVANHTKSHKDMTKITDQSEFSKQLTELEDIYRDKIGLELSKFYRPPEGRFSEQNMKYTNDMGYKTIFWSFAYADWDNDNQLSPSDAMKKVLAHTHNGSVILLHPTSETNAAIMGDLIREWKSQGYRFGTLNELVSQNNQNQ